MIVVSDTSPLNYLILIGESDLLQRLYGDVVIPPAVHGEFQHPSTPPLVRQWLARPPEWLRIHEPATPPDELLSRLGPGEREAIVLAEELRANAILADERDGRRIAVRRHLTVIGTLQILDSAAESGLIDFPAVLARLQATTFRVSPRLAAVFLDRDAQRKRRSRSAED